MLLFRTFRTCQKSSATFATMSIYVTIRLKQLSKVRITCFRKWHSERGEKIQFSNKYNSALMMSQLRKLLNIFSAALFPLI